MDGSLNERASPKPIHRNILIKQTGPLQSHWSLGLSLGLTLFSIPPPIFTTRTAPIIRKFSLGYFV